MELKDIVQVATLIGVVIAGVITTLNYLHSRKTLREMRLAERRKTLVTRPNDFYGHLLTYLSVIDSFYRLFVVGKPKAFRTLTYLLDPDQLYETLQGPSKIVLSDSDKKQIEINPLDPRAHASLGRMSILSFLRILAFSLSSWLISESCEWLTRKRSRRRLNGTDPMFTPGSWTRFFGITSRICKKNSLILVDKLTIRQCQGPQGSHTTRPPLAASCRKLQSTTAVKQSLRTRELDCSDYAKSTNPPILHRKETFLPPGHALAAKFARLTRQEEKRGLLDETATIGTREGWERRLAERGFEVRGHRLVRRKGEKEGKGEEMEPRN